MLTRTSLWGIVTLLALLGCEGKPAPAPAPLIEAKELAEPPAVTPTTPIDPKNPPAYVDRFVPPVLGKAPQLPFKIEYRTQVGDLGVIRPGAKAEHKFAVTNDSKIDWTVKYVTPGCNCAVGEFSLKTIKPGETSHLTVGIRADQREGAFVGTLAVDFWEPESPKFMLYLHSEIRKPLSIVPDTLDLGRVGPLDQVAKSVEVRNYTTSDIPPPTIDAPPWLKVQLTPVEKPAEDNRARQTWKLDIQGDLAQLKAAAEPGQLLVRGDAKGDAVTIPVVLKRKAPLDPAPAEVVFEKFTAGQAHERIFLLETYPDLSALTPKDFVLEHNLGDEFTAEVVKQLGPNRFQVATRYHPKGRYASVEGELTVHVRARDVPPARVQVKGTGG